MYGEGNIDGNFCLVLSRSSAIEILRIKFETLFAREYMVRQKKSFVFTEKGLAVYSIVKGMKIGNAEMTGQGHPNIIA